MERMKVYIQKEELANMSKEDLQEKLNGLIENKIIPPDITPDDVEPFGPEDLQRWREESEALIAGKTDEEIHKMCIESIKENIKRYGVR